MQLWGNMITVFLDKKGRPLNKGGRVGIKTIIPYVPYVSSVQKKGKKIKSVCMRGRGLWRMLAENDKI